MKKIVLIVVGMIVIGIAFGSRFGYNSFIKPDGEVKPEWNQSKAQHQRRSDLISNPAGTVKGAAPFEQTTFTQVIKTPTEAMQTDVEHTNMIATKGFSRTSQFCTTSSTNLISVSFRLNGQVLTLNWCKYTKYWIDAISIDEEHMSWISSLRKLADALIKKSKEYYQLFRKKN